MFDVLHRAAVAGHLLAASHLGFGHLRDGSHASEAWRRHESEEQEPGEDGTRKTHVDRIRQWVGVCVRWSHPVAQEQKLSDEDGAQSCGIYVRCTHPKPND